MKKKLPLRQVFSSGTRNAGRDATVSRINGRKRLEEDLRESREQFMAVLENALDAAYRRNLQTDRYDYLSPVIAKIVGFTAAEMGRLKIDEVLARVHPEDLPSLREVMSRASAAGQGIFEYRFKCKDGNYRWLADYFSVQKDAQGRPLYLSGIVRDVTEHKLLEKELRDSEEEFRSMFQLSAVGKAQVDPATRRFIRVNKKFCDLTLYSAAELLGMTVSQITHPEDRHRDRETFDRALKREIPGWMSEKRYVRRDGAIIWVKVTGSLIFDADGRPLRSVAVVEDITESKKAEQAIRESEERYRSLVESFPDCICVYQDGACVYMNPAGQRLFKAGASGPERSKKIDQFIHPDFAETAAEWLRQATEKGKAAPTRELKMLRSDGQEADVEATATPIVYNGKPATQIIIKDVTESRKTELRMRLQATVLAQVSDAVVAVGKDGRIVFWNKGAARLYGLTAEEAIGKRREEVYRYRWIRPEDEQAARESMESSGFLRGENIHILRNGQEIVVESAVSVLLDWAGAPSGRLAVMRDVTERKIFERKLKESEERYRSLVESSPDAIIVSQDGRLVFANGASARLLKARDPGRLIGRRALDFVHPDFRTAAAERIGQAETNGQPGQALQLKILGLDGTVVDIESVVSPIAFQGRPAAQIIAKDITERKMFEEALLNSEKLFRLMFESNPHPMWIYDTATLKFLFVNDAAIAHYGYSIEEFRSMTQRDILAAEDDADLFAAVSRIAAGLYDSGSWRHRKKDGMVITVENMSHVLQVDGKDARVVLAHDITDRKKAEQALQESEKKYRDLVEASHDLIWSIDTKGRITFINQACRHIYGYEPEELIGRQFFELMAPGQEMTLQGFLCSLRNSDTALGVESRVLHKDGRELLLSANLKVQRDPDGKVIGVSGISQDITERKRAEKAIKEARDAALREHSRLEIILNTIPSGVFVAEGPEGAITVENEQARILVGREVDGGGMPPETRIQKWEMRRADGTLFKPEELPYLRALRNGENVRDVELTLTRPDGTQVTVLANAAPLRDANGDIVASVSAFSDITERKHAEDQLKSASVELERRVRERTAQLAATIEALQSEIAERRRTAAERDMLVAAVESTEEAVVVTDKRGYIQYVNPAFERITGYQKTEAIGKDLHILDSGQHDETFFRRMQEALRERGGWKGRLINKKKDGTIYYEDCTYSQVRDRSGNVTNYVSIKHDITETLRLESIAETVDTMNNIGYVFSGIRHEIGNPVSSLLIIMSLLKKKYDSGSKEAIKDYLDQAIAQVERIEYLLSTLKNFNMYENLQIKSIPVSAFLENFVPLIASDLTKKGVQLQMEAGTEDMLISADPRALQQALLNIVVNASDAVTGRPAPAIALAVFKTGNMIQVRVSDNGPGIPEERRKDLFKPFYTTKVHGTGLGLVITRKMVSRMKGFIEISSQKDQGTIVDIYLPEGSVERSA